jgi:hypothetical protein
VLASLRRSQVLVGFAIVAGKRDTGFSLVRGEGLRLCAERVCDVVTRVSRRGGAGRGGAGRGGREVSTRARPTAVTTPS